MSFPINSAIISVQFAIIGTASAISIPGLKVGDTLIAANFATGSQGPVTGLGFWEGVVTVDDELQQLVTNGSPGTLFNAVFVRLG